MAETFGSLFEKLTIVKLTHWQFEDRARLASLDAIDSACRSILERAIACD